MLSKQTFTSEPTQLHRKQSIKNASMLIKKVHALRLDLFTLKHQYESIMAVVSPKEANF